MAFSVDEIRSRLRLGGARPTHFRVRLFAPNQIGLGNELSDAPFMVQSAAIPASTIGAIEIPYFGRKIRIAGDRTFAPWTVTILNDEDFRLRNALELWHNRINSLSGNINTTGSADPNNYKAEQLFVEQFSKLGGPPIRTYNLIGVFPTEISDIPLSWNATDEIQTFSVTFSYDYFEIVEGTIV